MDHVDGHRTIAYCVSPYTRRGAVVSEVYNHTSFLRTMETGAGSAGDESLRSNGDADDDLFRR